MEITSNKQFFEKNSERVEEANREPKAETNIKIDENRK